MEMTVRRVCPIKMIARRLARRKMGTAVVMKLIAMRLVVRRATEMMRVRRI